jgi:outer membrane immunogenic protein
MKKILLSTVATVGLASSLVVAEPADAQSQEIIDSYGSGFYIGIHGVYGAAEFDALFDATGGSPLPLNETDHGGGGGLHAGFNHLFQSGFEGIDAFLIGVEGDLTIMDLQASASDVGPQFIDADLNLLSSVRARLGVLFDGILIFATGGIAFADWDYSVRDPSNGDFGATTFFDVGGVVGGGVEFDVFDFAIFRIEGLYYIFDGDHNTGALALGTSDPADFAELGNIYVVRAGFSIPLNNLFGPLN